MVQFCKYARYFCLCRPAVARAHTGTRVHVPAKSFEPMAVAQKDLLLCSILQRMEESGRDSCFPPSCICVRLPSDWQCHGTAWHSSPRLMVLRPAREHPNSCI